MMTRLLVLAALSFAPGGDLPEPDIPAGVPCDYHALVLARLAAGYMHESVRMAGNATDNGDPGRPVVAIMEITAQDEGSNPATRSWSLVMTDPKTGRACLVAGGDRFEVR